MTVSNKYVSVIITTFERNKFISRAIKSVQSQTYKYLEIFVVDDNTKNEISNELVAICRVLGVVYLKNTRSKGGCGARNTGILAARGDLIAFLDDDDIWLPEKIEKQVAAFEKDRDIVGCYCGHYDYYENRDYFAKSVMTKLRYDREDLLKGGCPTSTSFVVIKKLDNSPDNLFNERLDSFQDLDMWLKVTRYGKMIGLDESLAVMCHHGGDRTSVNINKRISGLNCILEYWGEQITKHVDLELFRRDFMSSLYFINGINSEKYLESIDYKIKSFKNSRKGLKDFFWIAFSIFGNSIYWISMKKRKGVKELSEIKYLRSNMEIS